MIYKIALWFLLPMAILALFLSLAGVHQIEFGIEYYTFIGNVTRSFNDWKIEIPNIPKIAFLEDLGFDSTGLILGVLIKIANVFFFALNIIIDGLNIMVTVINILISVIQFVCTIFYQCKDFITRVSPNVA